MISGTSTVKELYDGAYRAHGRSEFVQEQALCDAMLTHPDAQGESPTARSWQAIARTQKSLSHFHAKQYDAALTEAELALTAAKTVAEAGVIELPDMQSPYYTLSRAYWMLGETQSKLGNPVEAQKAMVSARRMAGMANEQEFVEALDSSMVRVYLDANAPQQALEVAALVLKHREAKNDPRLGTSMLNLAEAHLACGNFDEAQDWATKALARRNQDNVAHESNRELLSWSPHKIKECEDVVSRAEKREGKIENPSRLLSDEYLKVVREAYGTRKQEGHTR